MDAFTTFSSLLFGTSESSIDTLSQTKCEDVDASCLPLDEEKNGGYGNNAYCVIA
ncbi:pheromone precursor [Agaricus bisporus var. burnettii JB137-S8]|uniref:Pheromone n=1 Tax=Agaricus bisporus var. burnettii (strain JB137-S8 / ATCC MYA-4627 / FGSC 10392) TaxID=597362 RepID=K5XSJ9_AGABU|nr:pheromone precursor [Agaricus bisporus var. burnettii JB137-S8]EKM77935.1 pheromone precursor [Agaricus bisporus var. burnettii JB137-S8]